MGLLADSNDVNRDAEMMLTQTEDGKPNNVGSTTKDAIATTKTAEPVPEGHPQDLPNESGARVLVANQQEDSFVEETNTMVEPLPLGLTPTGLRRGANIQADTLPGAYPGGASEPRGNVDYSVMVPDNTDPSQYQDPIGNNRAGNSDEGLAHARPVADPESLTRARQVDPSRMEQAVTKQKKDEQYQKKVLGFGCLTSLVVAIALIITLLRRGSSDDVSDDRASPSPAPYSSTLAPSLLPSSSPTLALELLMENLPEDTLEGIRTPFSPQFKAANWLSSHRNITNLPEWRKKQLFAMATFYYAFEGESWPLPIQKRWMDDTMEECFWYASSHGQFTPAGEFIPREHDPTCNEEGELISLDLSGLEIPGLRPHLPNEILLLTSLSFVELQVNKIDTTFLDMVPTELLQRLKDSQLTYFDVGRNAIHGGLPTEIGMLTHLTELDLGLNKLSGPLPTELGGLKHLTKLVLYDNDFTGPITTELGLLPTVKDLRLNNNALTGNIPTEVGTMTSLSRLRLYENQLTGTIPWNHLMGLEKLSRLLLDGNSFFGSLPTEIGLLSSVSHFSVSNNLFTGTLPSQIGLMPVKDAFLQNNEFTGTIPSQLNFTEDLRLDGNNLTGAVPPHLCEKLLCDCSNTPSTASTCLELEAQPDWPGRFPPNVANASNVLMLNIKTDWYPDETKFLWQQETNGVFETLLSSESDGVPERKIYLHSFEVMVRPNTNYRLTVLDKWGDGIAFGSGGWVTVVTTNQTVAFADERGAEFKEIKVNVEVTDDGSFQVTSQTILCSASVIC